jgi:putative spermidine/putrescine transport system substrate-binding protein
MRLAVAAALAGMLAVGASASAEELTVSTAGGVVSETESKVFGPAFEKATGWTIKYVSAENTRMAEIEAMLRANSTTWDVSEISASDYPIGVARNLLEPIDYSLIDPDKKLPDLARGEFGVVVASYSTVLVQRLDKNPQGKKMTSWADFWDTEAFPGPRSLGNRPQYNLEFALLADGVAKEDIYKTLSTEEGVDRAFAKLDEIKDSIPVWWDSGAQSVQLLSDGEVFYSTTYNGRIGALNQAGVPAEIVWNGGALHVSYMGIPKGSPNVKAAHEYIKLRTTNPELAREYLKVLPYPSFSPGLFDGMPEDQAKSMPTYPANAEMQFQADEAFWAQNLVKLQERWTEWLLQ